MGALALCANLCFTASAPCEASSWWLSGSGRSCSPSSACFEVWLWLRRPPDYSPNLCPPKTLAMWLFGGCFGPPSCCFSYIEGPRHPLQKSYSKCFRRTQIRWVIWRSSMTTRSAVPFFRGKKARFVHSHIHLAITGDCFTHPLHSREYIHSTHASTFTPFTRIYSLHSRE